ncbi:MAG: sulfate ABC transporter substrate-binding protein [Nostoc sp. ZfuVER08]|uniref:Sulfate ABC transporter substrate-binding protein n=1 Tax=Nostoc punctiforme FACHB-252 TaxID=1357509 RepID=A0ABR8HIV7_NOSPU|nr:sulfate ABC transporter substrate-binding protein [Nostoc punctiforme]MBD2615776.1 sulfate ABC transporter substrate-binding protein [Nostoc punctiforme FACHB-252]MDZ8014418.1 sulfate ABC transporter substrate-binding protein [Nostoc sp. ZfuVER08]
MKQWLRTSHSVRRLIKLVQIYTIRTVQATKNLHLRLIRSCLHRRYSWSLISLFLIGVSLSVAMTACSSQNTDNAGSVNSTAKDNVKLTLVSYSVTSEAYKQIIPKFIEQWKKEHQQDVTFEESYEGSGSQALAVIDGLEADVVHLSLALDVQKLVEAGLIQQGWEKEAPNDAIVTQSVGAIATRENNPKNIKTWTDLTQNQMQLITPNPKTSGGARWNFIGLWGSAIKTGKNEAQALNFISDVYQHVPVLPKTARNATELFFKKGQGDALINYENEMILSAQNGEKFSYVVPDVNISIDNPVAIVDTNVDKHGTRLVAEAFVKFLYTPDAQREFVKLGFRPVNVTIAKEVESKYPKIKTLFKVQDLGGWEKIQKQFFNEGAIFDQIKTKIRLKEV